MAADRTGRVWDEVRRALGRLAGRVSSHSLPEAQAGIAATVRDPQATGFPVAPGALQGKWRPFPSGARVWRLPAPTAVAGGGGVDASGVVTVIGEDRAMGRGTAAVLEAACRFGDVPIHVWTLGRDMPRVPPVQAAGVDVRAAARQAGVTLGPPATLSMQVVRVALPRGKPDGLTPWPVVPARTRSGLAPVLRVPILCRRVAQPPGAGAFVAERRLLAAAAGAPEADVALIGVFPHVPLGAVHKLSATADGAALQVWVRPDAVGRGAVTVTVVLGRQRSTGRMLQAVRRGVGTDPK